MGENRTYETFKRHLVPAEREIIILAGKQSTECENPPSRFVIYSPPLEPLQEPRTKYLGYYRCPGTGIRRVLHYKGKKIIPRMKFKNCPTPI